VSSTEAIQRAVVPALQVELPTASAAANNPDLSMGEECRNADLYMAVGEDAKSLDL
jgi:hypothetical protein